MNITEIATKLVTYCRTGQFDKCYTELYHPNTESIEPEGSPWGNVRGLKAIHDKGKRWNEQVHEVHDSHVSEPIIGDQYFACQMMTDLTHTDGNRVKLNEVCLYLVKDGKITREQFFYALE